MKEKSQSTPSSPLIASIARTSSPVSSRRSANLRSITYRGTATLLRGDLCWDQPSAESIARCFGPVRTAGLTQDRAHVVCGRVLADVQPAPDLPVRAPAGELDEDLVLPRAQAVGQARRGGLGACPELGRAAEQRGQACALGEP